MLPLFYQTHLQQHLTRTQFLVLSILLNLLNQKDKLSWSNYRECFPTQLPPESRRRP